MTRHVMHRDFEGYGPLDLRVVGAHRWAADPAAGFTAWLTLSTTGRRSCGSRPIRCRQNGLRRRTIRTGS